MKNRDTLISGRTIAKAFDLADMMMSMYFKIEDMKKVRVKTVRSYFRRMRRKASLSSSAKQPSNYTAEAKDRQIEALLIKSEGDMR